MQALSIDSKTDDGLPTSGIIQYGDMIGGNPLIIGTPAAGAIFGALCYNTATYQYSPPAGGLGVCSLAFKRQ